MSDDDLRLYESALKLHPDLWTTVQIVRRARGAEKSRGNTIYPIRRHSDFLCLAETDRKTGDFDGFEVSLEQIERYFPKNFFPIEDEDALLGRVHAALLWGRQAHQLEARLVILQKERDEITRQLDDAKKEMV